MEDDGTSAVEDANGAFLYEETGFEAADETVCVFAPFAPLSHFVSKSMRRRISSCLEPMRGNWRRLHSDFN